MARNTIGFKKIKKLIAETKLPIITALTRGGTDHRVDLCLDDGSVMHLYKNGEMEKSDIRWNIDGWKEKHETTIR